MDAGFWFEVVGYAASGLIALSILQQSILRLRIIGFVGSVVGVVYGVLIDAYPVVLLNVVIAVIHAVSLGRLTSRRREQVSFMPVSADDPYLERFLDFHAEDFSRFFDPDVSLREATVTVFLLRDMVPAGLFAATRRGSELVVDVDYVVPRFRDLVLGRYLFSHLGELVDTEGVERVVAGARAEEHGRYLTRVGFREDGSGRWVRPLR